MTKTKNRKSDIIIIILLKSIIINSIKKRNYHLTINSSTSNEQLALYCCFFVVVDDDVDVKVEEVFGKKNMNGVGNLLLPTRIIPFFQSPSHHFFSIPFLTQEHLKFCAHNEMSRDMDGMIPERKEGKVEQNVRRSHERLLSQR